MSEKDQNLKSAILSKMREELKHLRQKRKEVILEKGLIAQDNKDLRENSAYIDLEQQEHALTSKIQNLIREIYDVSRK